MLRKISLAISSMALVFSALSGLAAAHAVVSPDKASIGSTETFTLRVPNERKVATIALRVVVPDGVESVTPYVKSGWSVDVKYDGSIPKEINWTGGSIPVGMVDGFDFRAQMPRKAGYINWKAYQTYEDGTVVSWDKAATEPSDDENETTGPYSTTNVVDDLSDKTETSKSSDNTLPIIASLLAVLFSIVAIQRSAGKN